MARLHLDSLSTKTTLRKFKTALESLPVDLNITYDEIWERIKAQNPDDADLAKKVVYWVFHAMRPLTVLELQHALAVEPGDTTLDADSIPDEDLIISVCAGIVTIQGDSNTVGLVHSTTQEYFERTAAQFFPEAQQEILRTCLTYLVFDEFDGGPCNSDEEVKTRLQERPLLQYAAKHWGLHVTGSLEELEEEAILDFLNHDSKMMSSLQILNIRAHQRERFTQFTPRNVTALWLASYFGFCYIAKLLLENGVEEDGENNDNAVGISPFELAASRGHEKMVRLLLRHKETRDINTAFHHAAWSGHEAVMRTLLEHGAEINAPNKIGMTALHLASQMGHEKLTRFLLEEGADITLRTDNGRVALFLAARLGQSEVTQVLLEHGNGHLYEVEVYVSCIRIAHRYRRPQVIDVLFNQMDRSLAIDQQGRTPLHLISATYQLALVERLLEKQLDARSLDKQKRTSLHYAAACGSPEVIERLLREGLDPAQPDIDQWTPLHWAARARKESNIKALMTAVGDDVPGMMFRWEPQIFGIDLGQVSQVEILMSIHNALTRGKSPSSNAAEIAPPPPLRPSLFTTVISLKMNVNEVIDSFSHWNIRCDGCDLVSLEKTIPSSTDTQLLLSPSSHSQTSLSSSFPLPPSASKHTANTAKFPSPPI